MGVRGLKSENSLRIRYGVFLHCTSISRCNRELGMGQLSSQGGFCNSKIFNIKRSIIVRRNLYTAYRARIVAVPTPPTPSASQ